MVGGAFAIISGLYLVPETVQLHGANLVSATSGPGTSTRKTIFDFAFIAPRIGTLQLLQMYETDANDVMIAMLIFSLLADISMSRNRMRPASSLFVFGFI